MKYKKRMLMLTLEMILALCFALVACDSNSGLVDTPTGDNYVAEVTHDSENRITPEIGNEIKDDYYGSYDSVISEWKEALNRYINDEHMGKDIFDFGFYSGYANSIKTYYALYDIDGNGVVELLLKKQNKYEDIVAYIYTIKNGEPISLFGYNSEGLPNEVPWSRVGSSKILDTGLIDCYDGDYTVYKIAENGYSVIKFASAQPYDYPDEANKAEAKWKFYINEIEVEYDFYVQCLNEQMYTENRINILANIDWKGID